MNSRKFYYNVLLIYKKGILNKVFLTLFITLLYFSELLAQDLQSQQGNLNNNVKNRAFYLKINNGPFSYKIIEEQHYLTTKNLFSWFTSQPIPSQEYDIKPFTNWTDISFALGYYNTFLSQNRIRSDLELKLTHTIPEKQEIYDTNFKVKSILNGYYDINIRPIKDLKIYFGFGIGFVITKNWFQKAQQNNNQDSEQITNGTYLNLTITNTFNIPPLIWTIQKMVGLEYQITDKISISGEYKNYTDYKIYINTEEYFNNSGVYMMHGKGLLIGLRYNF